jgi:pimeloyl-ACP methyl ester carboxylesterase
MAQVVLVHGAFNELWGPNEIAGRWVPALRDGLWHAGADIDPSEVAVAFYGDLFRHDPAVGAPTDLDRIATDMGLVDLVQQVQGSGGLEAIAKAIGQATFDRMIDQLGRYFESSETRAAVRERVASAITDDTEVVVAHSMGTIVTYEVLSTRTGPPVHLVTIGSPLGGPFVSSKLEPQPTGLPAGVRTWTNVAAAGDMACLNPQLATSFGELVIDLAIDNGHRAHDPEPYLNARVTGTAVAAALDL